jgi:hypothetical protein
VLAKQKDISAYNIIPGEQYDGPQGEQFLREMTNDPLRKSLPEGTGLRTLSDFQVRNGNGFRRIVGLLRMLDGIQLHRTRVGSAASIASFEEFLDNRFHGCESRHERLQRALTSAAPGTAAHDRAMKDLEEFKKYKNILTSQRKHFWRQAVAHEVVVLWHWKKNGEASVDVTFTLNELALRSFPAISLKGSKADVKELGNRAREDREEADRSGITEHPYRQEIEEWIDNVREEVILSEHTSQYPEPGNTTLGYLGVLTPNVTFR